MVVTKHPSHLTNAASMDREARNDLDQRRRRIRRQASATEAVEFFNILTSPELLETTESLLPEHRERLYPPTVTLAMFMRQTLKADGSCQKAVNSWAAQRAAEGLKPPQAYRRRKPALAFGKSRQRRLRQRCWCWEALST
jgi:hypothetical protein